MESLGSGVKRRPERVHVRERLPWAEGLSDAISCRGANCDEQVLTSVEIVVNARARQSGFAGDIDDRHAVGAMIGDIAGGNREDAGPLQGCEAMESGKRHDCKPMREPRH